MPLGNLPPQVAAQVLSLAPGQVTSSETTVSGAAGSAPALPKSVIDTRFWLSPAKFVDRN